MLAVRVPSGAPVLGALFRARLKASASARRITQALPTRRPRRRSSVNAWWTAGREIPINSAASVMLRRPAWGSGSGAIHAGAEHVPLFNPDSVGDVVGSAVKRAPSRLRRDRPAVKRNRVPALHATEQVEVAGPLPGGLGSETLEELRLALLQPA